MKCSLALRSGSSVAVMLLCGLIQIAYGDDVTATNITIQQAALFGTVYIDTSATSLAEGMRVDVSQGTAEIYHTSTTPGYYQDNWVTIEDYGNIDYGHWENTTDYQIVGYDTIPATYDSEGNIITPETYEPRWDWVITGSNWIVDGSTYGVTGTHQENQPVWQEEQTNSWTETTGGGTPRVKFNATRSDTNFVFRVPSPGESDGMKDVLVIWEGGLTLPNNDASRTSVFTSGSLQQTWSQPGQQWISNARAEVLTQTTNVQWAVNGVQHQDTSENESRPEYIRLTRTENVGGSSTVAQTQIAAKSATFAGVVVIGGDTKVQGAILVKPQGDLSMGAYTQGPQP